MKHLNDNLLCVIAAQTSGPNAELDDIVQFCCVPVDYNLEVADSPSVFIVNLQMRRGGIDEKFVRSSKILDIVSTGIDPYTALDVFVNWFESAKKNDTRKIQPIAYNWAFISRFLIDWMGIETFNYIFDYRYRDLIPMALYCNDRSSLKLENSYPYPKQTLTYICNVSDVTYTVHNDILQQAQSILKCYKKSMHKYIGV